MGGALYRRFAIAFAGTMAAAGPASASDDTLKEMTEKIDRAAEVMGTPQDAVTPALREAYPDIDHDAYSRCFARHATQSELAELQGGNIGSGATPSEIAADIAARPETITCITQDGLPGLPE